MKEIEKKKKPTERPEKKCTTNSNARDMRRDLFESKG